MEACRQDHDKTFLVNVAAVAQLTKDLLDQGAFVVYLSSNQVFDGSVAHTPPDHPYSPTSEYGRQKVEVERRISRYNGSVAIVRFTKILQPNHPLFFSWSSDLRSGRAIQPFSDLWFAPVPLSCVTSVLRLIADKRLSGI